ncbi:hypothetical protein LshimejAT787_0504540 [Lyophyllum shimeji]|uniref:Uncharacterized protein n=1 Tax=Lyophyllum shimeji TaxID=47721 RepID=A0A9P3UKW6_LYOSH|nr:hypothetical protein LshimejAT787_0504540 [Lyophyllum shimeji]
MLYPHARNALYRHLNLTAGNVLKASYALSKDVTLAAQVRSLILCGSDFEMSFGIIQDVLMLTPNLRTLVLMVGPYGAWILPQDDASPFQLHTFKSSVRYEQELHNFLTGQRHLRHLVLRSQSVETSRLKFTTDHLSALISISAPWPVVRRVVPERPVQWVTIYPNHLRDRTDQSALDCLSQSTARNGVERLSASRESLYAARTRIAALVPGLTHLTSNSCTIDPSEDADVLFPEWMQDIVSHLPCLFAFAIKLEPEISPIPCQEIDFTSLVTKVFEASPSLEHVLITFNRLRARYTCRRPPGEEDWRLCDKFDAF